MSVNRRPPSVERYSATSGTQTVFGSFGSTVTELKYQPRPQMRGSLLTCCHVEPPSSERYNPPCLQSMMAYTTLFFPAANPIRPNCPEGKPLPVSGCQVRPSSVDL